MHTDGHVGGRIVSYTKVDERSDDELLAAHLAGDPQALATLLKRYESWHYAIASKRIFGDKELARDGVQEAWITIYRKAHTFRGESKLSTWMYQIVDRACIDLLRKTQVRPQLAESEVSIEERGEEGRDFTEESEDRIQIYNALAQLPVEQREALVKVVLEGYSVEDAAQALDVPAGTIKSRCARGRATLATLLADMRPDSREPMGSPSRLSSRTRNGGGA
ncbi:MAG: hypothetical protein RLZZ07_1088 [Actinomycetota bacterium]